MKILVIANGYPDEREPQWGCFEKDQAVALANFGHQVSIMYVDGRFRLHWRCIGINKKNFHNYSVYQIFYLPLGWLKFNLTYKIYYYAVKRMLKKLYKEYCKDNGIPDVIYAHYIWNIAYATSLKEIDRTPLVGIEHWSGMTSPTLSIIAKFYGDIAYSNADTLLAVSQSLQTQIKRHFGKDSTVVYDMLGQEFITPKVLKREVDDKFTFVAVGSLIHRKGFDVLISAYAKSNLASKGCRVIIVGEGPEKNRLENQTNEFGISDYVSLVGRKTKEEIIRIMMKSHAFVLSSRAETFGVVCIEALSQGLPNIATVCGGPEEFINDKNGLLIPTEDIDAMAEAMCKMYENYSQYDNAAIANECLGKFSPQVIASQLTEIFNEVTN